METRYYIIHPNGRQRILADDDQEAMEKFLSHWSQKARWSMDNPSFQLLKETKEVLLERVKFSEGIWGTS